jgi:hypothetical protein
MSTHTLPWTFEELGKGENKSLEVQFEFYVTPGSRGDYWNPPEPPEVEVSDVHIVAMLDTNAQVSFSSSWHPWLKVIAFGLADRHRDRLMEALGERIGDYEDAARDEYYESKRDRLRGC